MSTPDYDSIPDTADLEPPTSDEIPLATLANTLAIRATRKDVAAIRHDVAEMRREAKQQAEERNKAWRDGAFRVAAGLFSGAVVMAGTVVGIAMKRGEEVEHARHVAEQTAEHDARITKLEERQWR